MLKDKNGKNISLKYRWGYLPYNTSAKGQFGIAFSVTNDYRDTNAEAELENCLDSKDLWEAIAKFTKEFQEKEGAIICLSPFKIFSGVISGYDYEAFKYTVKAVADFCKSMGITPTNRIDRIAVPSVTYVNDWLEYSFGIDGLSFVDLEQFLADVDGLQYPYNAVFSQENFVLNSEEEFNPGVNTDFGRPMDIIDETLDYIKNSIYTVSKQEQQIHMNLDRAIKENAPPREELSGMWT